MNTENKLLVVIDGSGYAVILPEPNCDNIEEWVEDRYGLNCQYQLVWSVIDRRDAHPDDLIQRAKALFFFSFVYFKRKFCHLMDNN